MIVKYTKANVLTIHVPKSEKTKELVTKQILPGNNEVSKEDWAKFLKHPAVKHLLDDGSLIEVGGPAKDSKKSSKGLEAYSSDEAKRIIGDTFNITLLEEWAADEKRNVVSTAIDKQIKKIEESTKPKKKDEDSEEDEG